VSRVTFLPEAREEFLDAFGEYRAVRAQLGREFLQEVERCARRAARFPNQGSLHLDGTRRIVLRRFPYSLIYRVSADEVVIAAVAHHRREPGYWADRLH
jgi:toxin ParE1/3/4